MEPLHSSRLGTRPIKNIAILAREREHHRKRRKEKGKKRERIKTCFFGLVLSLLSWFLKNARRER